MTREELRDLTITFADQNRKGILLEVITGYGKSKVAIDTVNHLINRDKKEYSILLLVAKTTHKQNWDDEITKWGGINSTNITVECYESLKKYKNSTFDIVIADEVHHIDTDIRRELLESITINKLFLGLSATVDKDFKYYLKVRYNSAVITCTLQEAIDNNILPTPNVYLVPLTLNDEENSDCILLNKESTLPLITTNWYGRAKYLYGRNYNPVKITCSQKQHYNYICSEIDRYKRLRMSIPHKRACNDRLKWLSDIKESYILDILKILKNKRTITFCSSIVQTERMGKYCINSKNKKSIEYLNMFNNKKIKHITSCQQLNEGVNLTDCQYGIYCNINASERINKQKFGRLLRHKKPIIIIPYFKDTREEEIVTDLIQEYDNSYIHTIELNKLLEII